MKALFLVMVFFSLSSFAGTFDLEAFDQDKLADLLDRLPYDVKKVQKYPSADRNSETRKTIFPVDESPLQISCERKYFNHSAYASLSSCIVKLAIDDPQVLHHFDEFEMNMEQELSEALFKAISYGRPKKVLRSYGSDPGVSFEGFESRIFHYQVQCSMEECVWRFSSKIHRP